MAQLSYDNTVRSRGAEPHTPRGRTVSEHTQVWHSSPQQQPESGSSTSVAATPSMAVSSSSSRAHGRDNAALSMALVPYGEPSTPPHRRRRRRSFYRETYTEADSWTFVMDSQVRATNTHTVLPVPSPIRSAPVCSRPPARNAGSHRFAPRCTPVSICARLFGVAEGYLSGGWADVVGAVAAARARGAPVVVAVPDGGGGRRHHGRAAPRAAAAVSCQPWSAGRRGAGAHPARAGGGGAGRNAAGTTHCSVRVSVLLDSRMLECGLWAQHLHMTPG